MSTYRRNLMWLLFCVLSGLDLFLTWRLLGQGPSRVYESNPLAAWCLGRFGWTGLAAYKLAAVLMVLGATAVLCRRRPRAGARVLTFGCSVLSAVVLYSSFLVGSAHGLVGSARAATVAGTPARHAVRHAAHHHRPANAWPLLRRATAVGPFTKS